MKKHHFRSVPDHVLFRLTIFILPMVLAFTSLTGFSQATGSQYFTGKPKFITTSVGKALTVDYAVKTTDNSDSVKVHCMYGMVDLASCVNKATDDPKGEYKDYLVMDASLIGIIGFYRLEYTLFYAEISDARDLYNRNISIPEFMKRVQVLSLPDYVPPTAAAPEKKPFLDFMKMDHEYYSFPMRLSILFPFGVNNNLGQGMGVELSNVWSRSRTVANFKFQLSLMWLKDEEGGDFERFIIPSYNMGIGFNFFGDVRFNLKPYVTIGWNPSYYYFESDSASSESPQNLKNGWYLNTYALNYGLDLEGWITKKLGISASIEQSRYLAELLPDVYGSSPAVNLSYYSFKIGLIF